MTRAEGHRISFEREGVEDEVMTALTAQRVCAEAAALPVAPRQAVVLDGARP